MAGELLRLRTNAIKLQFAEVLDWRAGRALTAYGVSFGVRANDAAVLALIDPHLPPGSQAVQSPAVDRLYSFVLAEGKSAVYADDKRIAHGTGTGVLLEAFEADLKLYVADMAEQWVFVHAGAVEWRGEAIILPGLSFSGKTLLVAALVKAGARYLSDEFAVLDFQGRAYPYARPLAIRASPGQSGGRYSAEALGGQTTEQPVPIGLVLISQYQADGAWQPAPRTPGEGALALLSNTVSARRQPANTLRAVQAVVERAAIVESARGEAAKTAGLLLDYFDQVRKN